MPLHRWFNLTEAGRHIGVPSATVRRLVLSGALPGYTHPLDPNRIRLLRHDVYAYLQQLRVDPDPRRRHRTRAILDTL